MRKYFLPLVIMLFTGCVPARSVFFNIPKVKTNRIFPKAEVRPDAEPFIFAEKIDSSIGKRQIVNIAYVPKPKRLETLLQKNKTRAFLLIRNDTVIYEKYFKGYDNTDELTSFSMAKSFVSTMVGIALSEGKIGSLQDPVTKYFPELDTARFGKVTLAHLLQHTSGIKYPGLGRIYYGRNLEKRMMKVGVKYPPGEKFYYENGNSQLLGMLIERQYGKPIYELFGERIWQNIGTESSMFWALDDKKNRQAKTFCCIDARTRDFARLGRLWMNKGNWEGRQLIPAAWMDSVSTPTIANGAAINYKYHFWQSPRAYNCFMAAGMYGQMIFMCPDRNLMIVRLGERCKLGKDDKFWIPVFLQLIDQL